MKKKKNLKKIEHIDVTYVESNPKYKYVETRPHKINKSEKKKEEPILSTGRLIDLILICIIGGFVIGILLITL